MIDVYNKLVRDKIPEIIRQQGHIPKVRVLDNTEYFNALNQKLSEELAEYLENGCVEELADIMEVVYAIIKHKGLSPDEFEKVRAQKSSERGAFDDRLYLVSVEANYTK